MIFIILSILLLNLCAHSQNFHAKIIGGLNAAQVDGDSYGGYNQPGLLLGMAILKKSNDKYHWGFELAYSQKGSHKKTTEDDPAPFQLRYNYVCLPLFIDYYNLGENLKKFYLKVGVSNNFNVGAKVDFGNGKEDTELKRWELSGLVGIGFNFNKKLGMVIRHENSVLSVGKPGKDPQFYKVNRTALRNRLVSFVLQYEL